MVGRKAVTSSMSTCCEKLVGQNKRSAGELLSAVRSVNQTVLRGFRSKLSTPLSEPYFYDSTYKCIKRYSGIPWDKHGRCFIAAAIELNKEAGYPGSWKCTAESKLPTEDEIKSILKANEFFKLPKPQELERTQIAGARMGTTRHLALLALRYASI